MNSNMVIDIVLLLPKEINDLAIHYNELAQQPSNQHTNLRKEGCYPHISLVMGVIERDQIQQIMPLLQQAAEKYLPLELKIKGFFQLNSFGFDIQRKPSLMQLQNDLMTELGPVVTHETTKEMFHHSSEPPEQGTIDWVEQFFHKQSGAQYFPHVTLGFGIQNFKMEKPVEFSVDTLALCHMGARGTCREVLGRIKV